MIDVEVNDVDVPWDDSTSTTGGSELVTDQIGEHTLSEIDVAGYTEGDWSCEDDEQAPVEGSPDVDNFAGAVVTLAAEDVVICTITNDDIAPTLTLVKTLVQDFGGTLTQDDFQARIDGDPVDWDVATPLSAGDHTASESASVADYTAGDWGGDCAADGSVTLSVGEVASCTITNTQDAPPIIEPIEPIVPVPASNAWTLVLLTLILLATGWYFRLAGVRRF